MSHAMTTILYAVDNPLVGSQNSLSYPEVCSAKGMPRGNIMDTETPDNYLYQVSSLLLKEEEKVKKKQAFVSHLSFNWVLTETCPLLLSLQSAMRTV